MGVQHSFEKMKPKTMFFLKKPSLVILFVSWPFPVSS